MMYLAIYKQPKRWDSEEETLIALVDGNSKEKVKEKIARRLSFLEKPDPDDYDDQDIYENDLKNYEDQVYNAMKYISVVGCNEGFLEI